MTLTTFVKRPSKVVPLIFIFSVKPR